MRRRLIQFPVLVESRSQKIVVPDPVVIENTEGMRIIAIQRYPRGATLSCVHTHAYVFAFIASMREKVEKSRNEAWCASGPTRLLHFPL